MSIIGIILLVVFVLICILLVSLVLLQNDEGGGLGGLLGGGGSQAFGSRSANVITKTTYTFVALFFVLAFLLAFINKTPKVRSLDPSIQQIKEASGETEWWLDGEENSSQAGNDLSEVDSQNEIPMTELQPAQTIDSLETTEALEMNLGEDSLGAEEVVE
ncbi:MAG: preprotein translocase subunit SecG [Treponemataceae bacterium]